MRKRLFGILAGTLVAAAAHATPILTVNGGTNPVDLAPGTQAQLSLELSISGNEPLAGYNLIFAISSPSSITVVSCTALGPNANASCADPTGVNFSFGANFGADQTGALVVATVTINAAAGALDGTTVTLTGASTWTDPNFEDFFFTQQTIARVVPEPATAALAALALGGLAFLGRKRSA